MDKVPPPSQPTLRRGGGVHRQASRMAPAAAQPQQLRQGASGAADTWRGLPRCPAQRCEPRPPAGVSPGRTGVRKATLGPQGGWAGHPRETSGPKKATCVQHLEGVPGLPCQPLVSACRDSKRTPDPGPTRPASALLPCKAVRAFFSTMSQNSSCVQRHCRAGELARQFRPYPGQAVRDPRAPESLSTP